MNIGKIQPVPIIEEMKKSYLDYAMSVIVSRALPDVKDGLKPVQRRIIYAMHQQGIHHTSRYQKSAAVVWEVLKIIIHMAIFLFMMPWSGWPKIFPCATC